MTAPDMPDSRDTGRPGSAWLSVDCVQKSDRAFSCIVACDRGL